MKDKILEIAKNIGIDEIGFTNTLNLDYLRPVLEKRISNNFSCEFEENNIDKRLNIKDYFVGCRSIICVAFPYAQGYKIPNKSNMGNLSVSSFGIDYHRIVKEKLNELAEKIKEIKSFNYTICVDTTPLVDRAICKNSGLGYIGNNSMLINSRYGSFVFLGYILTDLDISQDENKVNDSCGSCNICRIKCPNHAIQPDGTINTKRCVSYLTQTKDYIEIKYRKALGHQIYGCDICQYYCPKNKHILDLDTQCNYEELLVELKELFYISNKEFKIKYGHLAGSWRGKNIWKRNAIIASANMKLYEMFDIISEELKYDNDMIKLYASWALLEIDRDKAKDLIFKRIKYENEIVQNEYRKLLEVKNE
ncbi:tRNA epoxyqueuosine(34) reductase QueG [Sedimentibacter sp. zth1]|uniref:tRNA epoxyqueuosine(34) reductase QueG n=1 Tax=Sedimentibacter sp. zth1 TaxID=2816908 RepID=UPI001A93157D|nr:tRNA epoxyqueuosine(34) reductase QueG [Sedimentibacter sp. zth1]QSX06216.1 tRNA epoxyqueuosine(34) reductase QueG [Sedimentibacter sp. zth1]